MTDLTIEFEPADEYETDDDAGTPDEPQWEQASFFDAEAGFYPEASEASEEPCKQCPSLLFTSAEGDVSVCRSCGFVVTREVSA